ncbi:MAG TPA: hypothetical protein VE422_46780 [Terriglobia bacterium]|nr:hypothetical protein [Terriglobia bacterium]
MPTSPQADARFEEQVRSAPFIFSGQIVKPGASTVATLPPNDRLAIVKIDTVFRAPAVLGSLTGKRITVQIAAGKPMKTGAKALFYATSWLYGDGIAVVEVARADVPKDKKDMLARVAQAEIRLEDNKLTDRLSRADLVVSGIVADTRPVDRERPEPRSEHDPVWWQADIAVDRMEKGKVQSVIVLAYFPASLDEYWLDVPKLQPRQRGVFILHRGADDKRTILQPPGPALLHPLDFQPAVQLDRVRALLKLASI